MTNIHTAHALWPIVAVMALAGCSVPPQPEPTPTVMTGDFITPEESTVIVAGAFTNDSGCVVLRSEENAHPTLFVPGTKIVDDLLLSFPTGEHLELDEQFPGVVGMLVDAGSIPPSVDGYGTCVTASTDQVLVIARAPNLVSPFIIGQ